MVRAGQESNLLLPRSSQGITPFSPALYPLSYRHRVDKTQHTAPLQTLPLYRFGGKGKGHMVSYAMDEIFIDMAIKALPAWAAQDFDAVICPIGYDFLLLKHPERPPMLWDCLAAEPEWEMVDMRKWDDLRSMPRLGFLLGLRQESKRA